MNDEAFKARRSKQNQQDKVLQNLPPAVGVASGPFGDCGEVCFHPRATSLSVGKSLVKTAEVPPSARGGFESREGVRVVTFPLEMVGPGGRLSETELEQDYEGNHPLSAESLNRPDRSYQDILTMLRPGNNLSDSLYLLIPLEL